MHFNTEIAIRGLGLQLPQAKASEKETFCTCCGRPIKVGDPYQPLKFGADSFMDDAWFATRSHMACPWCAAALSSLVCKALGSCNSIVYTSEGAYPIATDEHRAWFLLNPPKGPFVVTASGTKNYQHVVWKAPVTLSSDLIFIGWPSRIMTIRHATLMRAVQVCREVGEAAKKIKEEGMAERKRKKAANDIPHPYVSLDRSLNDVDHAAIRSDIASMVGQSPIIAGGLAFLATLSLGETWALATLVKAKSVEPIKPEKLVLASDVLLTGKKKQKSKEK